MCKLITNVVSINLCYSLVVEKWTPIEIILDHILQVLPRGWLGGLSCFGKPVKWIPLKHHLALIAIISLLTAKTSSADLGWAGYHCTQIYYVWIFGIVHSHGLRYLIVKYGGQKGEGNYYDTFCRGIFLLKHIHFRIGSFHKSAQITCLV